MSNRLPIRFSDRTWNLIEAAATAEGLTPASWVRRLVEAKLGVSDPTEDDPVARLQPRGGLQSPRAEGEAIRGAMLKWSEGKRPETTNGGEYIVMDPSKYSVCGVLTDGRYCKRGKGHHGPHNGFYTP